MTSATVLLFVPCSGALMELDDRAKIETFMQAHESQLNLPPVQEGETIFEYVVDDKGKNSFCRFKDFFL